MTRFDKNHGFEIDVHPGRGRMGAVREPVRAGKRHQSHLRYAFAEDKRTLAWG